jgi:hypothetical protein
MVHVGGKEQGGGPLSGGGQCGFTSGMAGPDNNHIIIFHINSIDKIRKYNNRIKNRKKSNPGMHFQEQYMKMLGNTS